MPGIASPVTIGSGIVLPANYKEWDRVKLRVVVAHERSHVRQMDFYLQLLAGIYTAIFWFSPLGWWLKRTLASLGEAIGDRAGLDAAASDPATRKSFCNSRRCRAGIFQEWLWQGQAMSRIGLSGC